MLMSFDTSTTWRSVRSFCSARTTPRIWLSALPTGSPSTGSICGQRGLEIQAAERVAIAQRRERQCPPTSRRRVPPAHRACGSPDAHCAPLPTCPSCGCRVPRASSSADRRRVPRSGTAKLGSCISTFVSSTNSLRISTSGWPRWRRLLLHAAVAAASAASWRRCRRGRFARALHDAAGLTASLSSTSGDGSRLQERRGLFRATAARGRSRCCGSASDSAAASAGAPLARASVSLATACSALAALAAGRALPTALAAGRNRRLRVRRLPACFFDCSRRPGFGFVFFRRQEVAELGGGGRQRHGFPRKESGRISCAACRILLACRNTETASAVCARRRASVSKTPVRLGFDRLLGSCLQRGHRAHRGTGRGFHATQTKKPPSRTWGSAARHRFGGASHLPFPRSPGPCRPR